MTDWFSRFRLPPWAHQAKEWEHRDDKSRMRRWQMRTGKTKSIVDEACYWHETDQVDGVLVFGPNNVHLNWARKEIPKHIWDGTKYRSLAWDSQKSRNVGWQRWFSSFCQRKPDTLDFFMVNFEALNNKRFLGDFLSPWLESHPRYALVVDETHDARGHKSARSRELRRLRTRARFRRGLTGTITDNSPLHAWSQYEILKESALGFLSYGDFERYFAVKELQYIHRAGKKVQVEQITGFRNLDDLTRAMAGITSVVLREECDDLPELQQDEVRFELTHEQKRVYNQIVAGALARLDGGEVIPVKEGGALKSQLQQVASGWYVDGDGDVVEVVPDADNPWLQALLGELALCGPKTIIFCRFVEDIRRVMRACKAAGFLPVDYYGGTKKADRPRNEDRFMNDERFGPFVGQPLACGQGLDLSVADWIIWYSHLDGDLIKRKQANERATQKGGGRIGLLDMVGEGTGDAQLLRDMEGKHEVSEAVSGEGLRQYLRMVE